ncbi:Glutamyl-tRNA Gln amidotransferase subunit C mitochondrial [Taenia crassiceps]|uniref:Glutamyl-tRNA Gln amidotransferase subunit C mitochondrial n=1 Tax=Taenia crassiceps TaxID=6207 RepID=A0ABR4Q665_9CEST
MNGLTRLLVPRFSLVHRGRRSYRFIPSKPLWRWHDDRSPCSDSSVFSIPPEEIPPRIELDDQTLKLLEQLSLVNFNKKTTKAIVEEAIHFANCLLTPTAFRGGATRATVEPMISLLGEEGWEPVEVVVEGQKKGSDSTFTIAAHILHHAPVIWENYFVAPPGNRPIHPELVGRTGSSGG